MKRKSINKILRSDLIIFFAIITLASSFLLLKTVLKDKYVEKKEPDFSYNNRAIVNYIVNLNNNPIYEKKVLGEGQIYITDYINNINTIFRYNFSGDRAAEIYGEFEVNALVESTISDDKEAKSIWSKNINIMPKTKFKISNKDGQFTKEIPINIKSFNDMVSNANKSLDIGTTDKLTILWNVKITGKNYSGKFTEVLTPKMEIPLGEKYFEIGGNLSLDKNGSIDKKVKTISPNYNKNIKVFSIILGVSLLSLLYILIFTLPKKNKKLYSERTRKILKNYEDRLVALKDEPLDGTETVIRVLDVEGLVKIADDLDKPILYKHSLNIEDIKFLYVLDNKKAYLYQII